jgi:hypothetical protein
MWTPVSFHRVDSLEVISGRGGMFTNALVNVSAKDRARHDRDKSGLIDLGEFYSTVEDRGQRLTIIPGLRCARLPPCTAAISPNPS